jgi:RNA polymerase sigma factor (sigma-70 family)
MSPDTSFDDLMRRLREGDEDAARELVEAHEDEVRRFVRQRIDSPQMRRLMDSVDVTQSAFFLLFQDARAGKIDLRDAEHLRTLLLSIAKHKLIDKARGLKAKKRDVRRNEVGGDEPLGEIARRESTPGSIVANQELLSLVRRELPAEDHDLVMASLGGESYADLAIRFGGTPESIRKRVYRIIKKLPDDFLRRAGGDR